MVFATANAVLEWQRLRMSFQMAVVRRAEELPQTFVGPIPPFGGELILSSGQSSLCSGVQAGLGKARYKQYKGARTTLTEAGGDWAMATAVPVVVGGTPGMLCTVPATTCASPSAGNRQRYQQLELCTLILFIAFPD